jgi:galactokinase
MQQVFFAPGRVNLIGEHLDYNGGVVLPAALSIGIKGHFTLKQNDSILLRSASHPFKKEININERLSYDTSNDWANYPIGVMQHLKQAGFQLPACEILFESNLPEGSGLSSSAAIEVLTGFMMLSAMQKDIDRVWLAQFCKQVENEFIGVNCGIMDQFSVAMGKAENAVLLNCETLSYEYIPIYLNEHRLLLMDTKKPRKLVHSKYNERKQACEEALRVLQQHFPLKNLCEAEMPQLELIKDEEIRKRARHVITENLRVKESVKALRMNDLSTFGRLMNASHQSLKIDYEVTGPELDLLSEEAQKVKGCLGARMTGAGFGGCAIALVHSSALEELKNKVGAKYLELTGRDCEIYESQIGGGVRTAPSVPEGKTKRRK